MSEPLSVSLPVAADMLGISAEHLSNNYKTWGVPHVRLGQRVVFPLPELRAWLSDEAAKSRSQAA